MKNLRSIFLCAAIAASVSAPTYAQWVVIDPAAIAEAVANGMTLAEQLTELQAQLEVAQQQYDSLNGSRNMGGLLSGQPRNGLPDNWNEAMSLLNSDVGASALQILESQAVLTPAETSTLSPQMKSHLEQMRGMSASQQAIGQKAYASSAERIEILQRLTNSIDSSTDPKAIMDLQAAAQAEQAKLANDQAQLQSVLQLTQANEAAAKQMQNELRMQVSGEPDFPSLDTSIH